jgi:hypothetical protein
VCFLWEGIDFLGAIYVKIKLQTVKNIRLIQCLLLFFQSVISVGSCPVVCWHVFYQHECNWKPYRSISIHHHLIYACCMSGPSLLTECCSALDTAAQCHLHHVVTHSTTRAWTEVKSYFYVPTALLQFLITGMGGDSVISVATRSWTARTSLRIPAETRYFYPPKHPDRL